MGDGACRWPSARQAVQYGDDVSPPPARAPSLATQLLDAQVAYHLERLSDDRLATTVAALAEDLLAVGARHQVEHLVDREVVTAIAVSALVSLPASAAVGGIRELTTEVVLDGPAEQYPVGELVERDQVEVFLDSVLALAPVLGRLGEAMADVALVGATASRFMGRIAGEVMLANKAVADKVPGLGSLMSLGTGAAARVVGAADKQFEGLISDTVGRSGAFAVRRLNRIVLETLLDPTTRAAALQAWDVMALEHVAGVSDEPTRERVGHVAVAVHDLVITALASDHAAELAEALVEGFFDRFGGYTPAELLDELDLSREDVVADVVRLAPLVVGALRESGDLERLLRARLQPFYDSAAVRDLLR